MSAPHRHGRTEFFIEGERFAPSGMPSPRLKKILPKVEKALEDAVPLSEEKRAFRFCRLFPKGANQPDDAA